LTDAPAIGAVVQRVVDDAQQNGDPDGLAVGGRAVGVQSVIGEGELLGVVVVAEPAPARRGWRDLYGLDPLEAGVLAVAAAAMGWWLAGRITRPMARLTDRARSLVLAGSAEPLPASRITEVAVLGSAIELVRARIRSEAEQHQELELDLRRLAHELRTPLTTIRLRLDDLAEPAADDFTGAGTDDGAAATSHTDHALRTIEGQLDRLDRLAAQLSSLRHARPHTAPVDLADRAAAAVHRLRPLADWGRVELHAGALTRAVVLAEPAALEDAISNVVENAIKYSPRGSTVSVTSVPGDEWSALEVSDEGPGIGEAVRDVVLRPGVRVEGPNRVRGSGQGLAIVAATLDRWGGRLEIADGPKGGALVRLVLPTFDADDALAADDGVSSRAGRG
jgi:two-component system sensor histidine kinase MprB